MKLNINNKCIEFKECIRFFDRLKGLMFKKSIGECLRFPNCNSIHTFFMFSNIDVIMTDKNNNVLYIYRNLKPWKLILPKKNVYYTYELPGGTLSKLKINDKIKKLDN